MQRLCLTILLSAGLFTTPVLAEQPLTYNRVSFQEQASTEVDNDLLVAVLFAQAEGRETREPADEVNQTITWAVDTANKVPGVKVTTLSYHTNAVYRKNVISGWRVTQSIRLESRDGRGLGELVGDLQGRLGVQAIGYQVSDEQRRSYTGQLVDAALANFRDRAAAITKAMDRRSYQVVNLDINSGQSSPPIRMARAMVMEADAMGAAPVRLEAGSQELQVKVSGTIELSND